MAKWVTFHDFLGNVSSLKVHDNKEAATKYFKAHYRSYFQLSCPIEVKLPMSYGYAHRRFVGMSKQMFEKRYGKIIEEQEGRIRQ